jgi:DNA-binding Lrp family transcriptional regulator
MLSQLQKQLLNDFQQDFPLSPTPYAEIANSLGVSEQEVLTALQELKTLDFISRIGPVFPPNTFGCSMLVAMTVPENQLQTVAKVINQFQEVNHNYYRENRFNLWFVLIGNNPDHLHTVISEIESETGYKAMRLPLLADYFINLGFELNWDD